MTSIPSADAWGPLAPGLRPAERLARLRALRTLVRLHCGPHGAGVWRLLAVAEVDPDPSVLRCALDALDDLPSLDRRRVLASYAHLNRDPAPAPARQ